MNNGTWFRWVVGGLVVAMFLLSGGIVKDVYSRIEKSATAGVDFVTRITVLEKVHDDIKSDLREIKEQLARIERKLK